ncbi:hypothetical protein F2Q70_00036385 [Brassica cretica]|uniref:Uncharacterized protein n=1 Tax=Brassica cretica TaxID=69181 RepID=A0A8S9JXE7_BRACR|nr:hypothetical protein F2Q70_00036385 [Brassica cretica]
MSFKRQNDTITVQEFISEFKQMTEAKRPLSYDLGPIFDEEEEQLDNPTQDSFLVTRRPLSYDLGPIFDEEAHLETIEQSDPKETKVAAKEELFQISTRTHFDDIFERYSHYSQPDPYILCFETLKEVEYAEKKLWTSLGKSNMEEGRVVTSVLNSQVQSKITEAVDFVFGESAFWNPAAKAKALLFK